MYCPKCKAEYRDGFEICPSCDCTLVEGLPQQESITPPMVPEVFLINVRDENEADMLEALMDSHGIMTARKHREAGGYLSVYMGITVLGIDIYVLESDYEAAKEILEAERVVMGEEADYELDDEQKLSLQEEKRWSRRRSIKAWIILIFLAPSFLVVMVYLILAWIKKVFK